jgi:hypothetical protein
LPNATQTGADIFACRINGANWISKSDIYSIIGHFNDDSLVAIGAHGGNFYFSALSLKLLGNTLQNSNYQITSAGPYRFYLSSDRDCHGYITPTFFYATEGNVALTKIDKTYKIISGIFNCKIPVASCDTLVITEGRFDIDYY